MNTDLDPNQLLAAHLGAQAKAIILEMALMSARAGTLSPEQMQEVLDWIDGKWQPVGDVKAWLNDVLPGVSEQLHHKLDAELTEVVRNSDTKDVTELLPQEKSDL